MALTLTPSPYQTVLDSDGNPVSGAKITTSTSGTTDALSTYTTAVGDVANANPIVADSAGRFVAYLSAGASYRFTITDASDVAIDTQDGIGSVPGSSVNLDITGTAGEAIAAGEVCYISGGDGSKTAGLWYLADADNAYSSTTAVEIGMAVSAIVINTAGTIRLAGEATTATSTVVGTTYYVSATAGAITSSAPALSRLVGIAPTTSSLILNANTLTIPVVVSQGGTGVSALTAYGVMLGGTTTTAAVQSITPAAAGQILKSGGTGAVAAWTDDPSVASITLADLTASVATFTDGSKTLVSNAITGSGNVVMSASPTMTGTIGAAALTLSTPLVVGSGGTGLSAAGSSGNVLTSDGSVWASSAAPTTNAAGSDTQVQFNDGGTSFGGDAGLVYVKGTDTLTLAGPFDISGSSAGQIAFPRTQNAIATATVLDMYEEGSWTPVIGGTGGTSGQTYATQDGDYVKIGKMVLVTCYVALNGKGTITGNVMISGLPFTMIGGAGGETNTSGAVYWRDLATNWVSIVANGQGSTNYRMTGATAAAASNITALTTSDIDDTSRFKFSGTFIASA